MGPTDFDNPSFFLFSRIIEPLASRCAKFRFKPLSEEVMSNRILHICSEEGLNLGGEVCTYAFKVFLFIYLVFVETAYTSYFPCRLFQL